MKLYARQLDTPLGPVAVATTLEGALARLHFVGDRAPRGRDAFAQRVEAAGHRLAWDGRSAQDVSEQLAAYFHGELRTFDLPLYSQGTAFQRRVWAHLQRIPFGSTVSYGDLAQRIGNPRACRAVGRASGDNPVAIVVPCHRVVGADGSLTGYAAGLRLKRSLLQLEGAGGHRQKARDVTALP